jgi:hypothetical protein
MKTKSTLLLLLLAVTSGAMAQNQITTPTGQPLVIGNQGIKHATLTSASATQATNGKVLSLDANGLFFLAPDAAGQWTNNSANIFFNTGNVGLGTNNPLQRLEVNGDINMPGSSNIRFNNLPFLTLKGSNSIAIGINAGGSNSDRNVYIGHEAGKNVGAPDNNIYLGYQSGFGATSGTLNSGVQNVFLGAKTGFSNTTGVYNLFIGSLSGESNTTGSFNAFFGAGSGNANTTGIANIFLGTNSGNKNTTGSGNLFFGNSSGRNNTTGTQNVFVGSGSGYVNITGNSNTFLGSQAGYSNSGDNNVFLGKDAGYYNGVGSNNVYIGTRARGNSTNLTNTVAIGYNAGVSINNAMVLGGTGSSQINVGIGNTAPSARFHVTAGGTTATGVRLQGLPNATGSIFKLYVDANGNVMKSSTAGAREGSDLLDGYWSVTPDEHLINTNAGGIILGSGIASTPKGYKLYVAQGILTEKVKVAIQNTDDWSDKVFADTYQLRSLGEVEAFINKNKHLPDVPSAIEVVEKGVDLGKMDALLLQKIEELTLYMIELKKSNEQLRKELNELKK